ncbi:hypothetical protein ABW636_10675 [Aquimarina sp. 2201CG1-2-11]|uniref:hypothetical protein n=1 Tax=Aquimarina discodermiae TaxID=3231043 RepID=UPI003462B3B1
MEIFKHFTKNKEEEAQSKNGVVKPIAEIDQSTSAYEESRACAGRTPNLKSSLETLYEQFFLRAKNNDYEQQKLKQPYTTEKESLLIKIPHKEEEIERIQKELDEIQSEIDTLSQEMTTPKKIKEVNDIKPKSNIKLWLGLGFLIPLSVYIFIFYISTSYSAFFKVFDPSISLFNSVFEADALSKAYEDGPLEVGFIFLIPFVFFSLGYLIHMFWSQKKTSSYLKVAGLLLLTFSFDAILAYLIDQKEYDFNKTPSSPEFTIIHAIQDPTFWLIIFAGFVSYLVWGLVFDMVMIENAKRDTTRFLRMELKEKISQKRKLLIQVKDKLETAKKEIETFRVRNKELECIIEGFILPIQNYKVFAIAYLKDWQKYISAELPMGQKEKIALLNECQTIYQSHIQELDLVADDYQNKVFTKTM